MRQLRQLAQRLAEGEIAPARRDLRRQQVGFEKGITGFTAALSGELGRIAPGTQAGYQGAAESTSGFAKGFSDGLAQIAERSGQEGAGDVLYGQGGFIPAGTLSREGAAFGAQARALPGTAALRGQEGLLSGQAKLREALTELEGSRPEKFREALQRLLEFELQKGGLRINAAALGETMRANDMDFALGKASLTQRQREARQRKAEAGKSPAEKKANRTQFFYEMRNEAFDLAKDLRRGKPNPKAGQFGQPDTIPLRYAEAQRRLWAAVGPDLKRRGFSVKRIRGMVRNVLIANGFRPPKKMPKPPRDGPIGAPGGPR